MREYSATHEDSRSATDHDAGAEQPQHAIRGGEDDARKVREHYGQGGRKYGPRRHAWERRMDRFTDGVFLIATTAALLLACHHGFE